MPGGAISPTAASPCVEPPLLTPLETAALLLSLKVGLVATAVSLPFGVAVAYLLARGQFPGKWLVDGLVHLPLVLPPVVVGYLLLVLLGRNGIAGRWLYDTLGISLAFTWKGAAVAAAVMAFPLMVRAIHLSIEAVDRGIEDAARTLGAGPFRVLFTVTLPLAAPGLLAGTVLGFARALGEFGATITFAANIPGETQTLPNAVHTLLEMPGQEWLVMRLSLISVAVALAALLASQVLAVRMNRALRGTRRRPS
jgi:molybdate transport system permease protein